MKRYVSLVLGLVLILGIDEASFSQTISWMGVNWDVPYGSAAVNLSTGNLEVTTSAYSSSSWGAAHYNTPTSFRNASTPWVEFSFIDDGPTEAGGQLWMEKEGSPNAAWTQFGAWQSSTTYGAYWWNVDTNVDGFEYFGARTAGSHTIKLGMRSNGIVDYLLDGSLVFSTTNITPSYFGDIYLAGNSLLANPGETVVFTNYQTGTDYTVIPEPATICLFAVGLLGLGVVARKRIG